MELHGVWGGFPLLPVGDWNVLHQTEDGSQIWKVIPKSWEKISQDFFVSITFYEYNLMFSALAL